MCGGDVLDMIVLNSMFSLCPFIIRKYLMAKSICHLFDEQVD